MRVAWEGNRSDGSVISGSAGGITLWAGGTDNEDVLNAAVGAALGANFYTSFDLNGSLQEGDSWIVYSQAKVDGTADLVTVDLYDGKYATVGNLGGVTSVTYAFKDGALDNKNVSINQMIRSGAGTYEQLRYNLEFGTVDRNGEAVQGERSGAGNYWANTGGVPSWYSHTYYGTDTTYYFASADPANVVRSAVVDRQNEMNASLMFVYDGNSFTVHGKGFDRNGGNVLSDATETLTAQQMLDIAAGGAVTIHGIEFTNLHIDTSQLVDGDKFVINVAAAAKVDGVNTDPANGAFQSTANVAIAGKPFENNSDDWGSSAQYRLANGAEDGASLNLLGYYIDPLAGNSNDVGVGYYDGDLILTGGANGFAKTSTAGVPGVGNAGAFWIRAELNNQGNTEPIAAAMLTSAYLQQLEADASKSVKDFIQSINYSNYAYGRRSDDTYGPLDEPGSEVYNTNNASVVFDVLSVENNTLRMRIQAHVIDMDGNQWYVEEEEYVLNGDVNASVLNPFVLFQDSAFGGLYFDEFTLGNSALWSAGDRFTLSLTASGSASSNIDEVNIYSDARGTNMPHSFRFNEGVLDNKTVDFRIYQVANNSSKPTSANYSKDQVMDGTLSVNFSEITEEHAKSAASFEVAYKRGIDAGVAHYYSKLEDVAQFWDANGRFILANNDEQLTIRQDDREIKVTIGSSLEIGQLAAYISQSIWLGLLGQQDGVLRGANDTFPSNYRPYLLGNDDLPSIFKFVNNAPGGNDTESVVGTFLAHSVLPGRANELKFYGSEALLRALSFNTIKEATNTQYSISVFDAHNGNFVQRNSKIEAGSWVYSIISDSIALDIASDIGLRRVTYDKANGVFVSTIEDQFDQYVHLADNSLQMQIGANEGEKMLLSLGDMTAKALGLENLDVRDRESAGRSITRIDEAMKKVSTQRAIIGAQINRLEYTATNLASASTRLNESASRIKDLDIAKEMMAFTKLNILSQVGNSMMSHALQVNDNILRLMQ